MSKARLSPKELNADITEQVPEPIRKLVAFFNSETGSIITAIVQAIVLPLLATGFIYLFRNPLNMSFGECIPTALFIAPLQLAVKLIPKTLTEASSWEKIKIRGTVLKTVLGALFVGLGLIGSSMLASRLLIGSFAFAPYIMSGLSIAAMIAAAFASNDIVSLIDEKGESPRTESEKRRDTFIITLIAILFLVSLASLFIGLYAAALVMVIMLVFTAVVALYSASDDEKKSDVEKGKQKAGDEPQTKEEKPKVDYEISVTEITDSTKQ